MVPILSGRIGNVGLEWCPEALGPRMADGIQPNYGLSVFAPEPTRPTLAQGLRRFPFMPLETTSQEFLLLLRQFEKGNVVLFAGAGFSMGARNRRNTDPPDARTLAETLATECGWSYQNEELSVVYAQAESHLGTSGIRALLSGLYEECTPAPWHYLVSKLYWYRIYSTNIDDVVQRLYSRDPVQNLHTIVCPAAYVDPDPWFQDVQCIHLHGSVLDPTKPLTFTVAALSEQTAVHNPWYQQLVEDMQSKSVVFLGTRLAEAPFYHYLTLRTKRPAGATEIRAKCFVVAPQSSPILRREFERQGYAVIDATADGFLTVLAERVRAVVSNNIAILKNRYPHQIHALAAGILRDQSELLKEFDLVSIIEAGPEARPRSGFLLGAEPTWADIAHNVDAKRGITATLESQLTSSAAGVQLFVLLGPAGSGKSTTLRRTAYELARGGHTVYFSKALQRLDPRPLVELGHISHSSRIFVFIDDAVGQIEVLNDVFGALSGSANITFVIADQSHLLNPRIAHLKMRPSQIPSMPHLDQADCDAILDKLHHFGLLGVLTGKPRAEQLREFLVRSRKQLLVAMKEATSGRGFDIIIAQEYGTLASSAAQFAYAVSCLAFMHGAAVRRRHLLACLDGSDYDKALTLKSQLIDVLVPWKESQEFLAPRHRVIARQVVAETAPREVLQAAIVRFIQTIAADITPQNITRRTPEYLAFRGIINFDNMRLAFGDAYESIDGVYSDLKAYCDRNFLFWLQRGRSEVHFDRFETAQNYLDASLSIRNSFQAWHYLGVLNLKRASAEPNAAVASDLAVRGEEILRTQIRERGALDAYPYAALIEHKLRYLSRHPGSKLRSEIEELYKLSQTAIERHPFDAAVKAAHEEAYRTYLMLAVYPHRAAPVLGAVSNREQVSLDDEAEIPEGE